VQNTSCCLGAFGAYRRQRNNNNKISCIGGLVICELGNGELVKFGLVVRTEKCTFCLKEDGRCLRRAEDYYALCLCNTQNDAHIIVKALCCVLSS